MAEVTWCSQPPAHFPLIRLLTEAGSPQEVGAVTKIGPEHTAVLSKESIKAVFFSTLAPHTEAKVLSYLVCL